MKKIKAVLAVSIALNLIAAAVLARPLVMPASGYVTGCLSVGHATSLESILKAAACPSLESKFELSPGACQAAHLQEASIWKVLASECPSGKKYQAVGRFLGDWTPQ